MRRSEGYEILGLQGFCGTEQRPIMDGVPNGQSEVVLDCLKQIALADNALEVVVPQFDVVDLLTDLLDVPPQPIATFTIP